MAHPAKTRILYLVPSTELGGAEISFLSLLTHLDKERFEPCVLISSEGPLVSKLRHLNIPLMTYNKTPNLFNLDWLLRQQLWFRLRKQLQDFQPGLIHSNSIYTSTLAQFLGKKLGCPQCHHWRDNTVPNWISPLLKKPKNSQIIAISNTVHKTIKDAFPQTKTPIHIVYNGADLTQFSPKDQTTLKRSLGIPKDHLLLGFFAALRPWKGLHLLLKALKESLPIPLSLLVVGDWADDDYKKELLPIIETAPLNKHIYMMGFQDDPAPYMQAVDGIVMASTSNEAFGRVIAEGFACEKAVIGHDCGAIPELVTHNKTGLLVTPNDIEHWKRVFTQLCKDPTQLTVMGQQALIASKHYCIKHHTSQIEHVYTTLIGSHRT